MGQLKEHVSADGDVEVVRNSASMKSRLPELALNLTCGTMEPYNHFGSRSESDGEDESDDDESSYLPFPTRKPNRSSSLLEENIELPSLASKESGTDEFSAFHPDLKAAVLAEGQEAVWMEDEVSTVSSVFVKSPPKQPVEKRSEPVQPPKRNKLNRFLFRQKPELMPEVVEEEPEPVKMHVRKTKVKKAVVLLPQQGGGGANTLIEANVTQEAAVNMVKARQLLNQALAVEEGTPRLEDSEKLAQFAFAHATAARRLMSTSDERPGLEEVLSSLAEKGEHAAFQHQKIVFSQTFEDSPRTLKKNAFGKGMLSALPFASKAINILESILPKNVAQDITDSIPGNPWSDEGASSLGLDTDTIEYQMCRAPYSKNLANMDLMSLSSLNEILDGPLEDEMSSPRKSVPVIEVPTKKSQRRTKAGRKSLPGGILGFMSPTNTSEKKKGIREKARNAKQEAEMSTEETMKHKKKGKFIPLGLKGKQMHAYESEQTRDEEETKENRTEDSKLSDVNDGTKKARKGADEASLQKTTSAMLALHSLPSVPSKSFDDSEVEDKAKIDRYRSIHFKQLEEKKVHVGFDDVNLSSDDIEDADKTDQRQHEMSKPSSSDWSENTKSVQINLGRSRSRNRQQVLQSNSDGDWDAPKGDWDESVDLRIDTVTKDRRKSQSRPDQNQAQTEPPKKERGFANKGELGNKRQNQPSNEAMGDRSKQRAKESKEDTKISEGKEVVGRRREERSLGKEDQMPRDGSQSFKTKALGGMDRRRDEYSLDKEDRMSRNDGESFETKAMRDRARPPSINIENDDNTQTTSPGLNSLINFVISPGRAKIMTYGNGHLSSAQSPSNTMKELLKPSTSYMDEDGEQARSSTDNNNVVRSEKLEVDARKSSSEPKNPKLIALIAGIFGNRSRGKEKEKIETQEDPKSQEITSDIDDLEKAVSDGNMKAVEANFNAEDAPSRILPSMKQRPQETQPEIIEKAISNGNMKAQEANRLSEEAPLVSRLKAIRNNDEKAGGKRRERRGGLVQSEDPLVSHLKSIGRKVSSKEGAAPTPVREANVVQGDLDDPLVSHLKSLQNKKSTTRYEQRSSKTKDRTVYIDEPQENEDPNRAEPGQNEAARNRDTSGKDAPSGSLKIATDVHRMDPPKTSEAKFHSLAPTPRKSDEETCHSDNDKYDQRVITQRLYGGGTGQPQKPLPEKSKGAYIGDMIIGTASTEHSEDSVDSPTNTNSNASKLSQSSSPAVTRNHWVAKVEVEKRVRSRVPLGSSASA